MQDNKSRCDGFSPPTMPPPLEILTSHLAAPATLPTRP